MAQADGTRRPRGEGSLAYNDERERWEGRLDLGRDPATGQRIRRKVSASTKTEAAARMRDLRREHADGLDTSRRTVAEVTAEWLTKSALRTKAPSTLSRVRRRVEQHLLPALGGHRVDQLRPEDVEAWLAAEVADGAALRTVQDYRGDLRQVLAWALRRRLVSWNVAAVAELPADARPPTEKRTLTEVQAAALLDVLSNPYVDVNGVEHVDRLGPYFTTLLLLGLRPGEADALTWDAIADDRAVIDRALQRDDFGRPLGVGPTKTKQTRVIDLPAVVLGELRRQRVAQAADRLAAGPGYSTRWEGHVFLNELGRPLNPSGVRRSFTSACERAGIPRFTPYELRHSAASLLIAAGVQPFEVADLLGHSDLRMLERHYRHRLNPVVGAAHQLAARVTGSQA